MVPVLLTVSGFAAAALAVGAVRRYALARSILDLPTLRSSHDVPTPSGAGIGLILAFVGLTGAFLFVVGITTQVAMALAAILALAGIGWLDDRRGVSVGLRLLVHVAAGIALLPLAVTAGGSLAVNALIGMAWVLAAVSAINVVNFMDGIDGLIGSQLLLFGVHLVALSPSGTQPHAWGLLLAATCAGFLVWNWPPARVFMGDAGSGALGLAAVAGGLLLLRAEDVPVVAVFLPLYPLFLDAATTLLRRILRRERVWKAHRSHLYQRLANGGWGHLRVTILYGAATATGVVVAALHGSQLWPALPTVYVLACLAAGISLDRAVPTGGAVARTR